MIIFPLVLILKNSGEIITVFITDEIEYSMGLNNYIISHDMEDLNKLSDKEIITLIRAFTSKQDEIDDNYIKKFKKRIGIPKKTINNKKCLLNKQLLSIEESFNCFLFLDHLLFLLWKFIFPL